jgi:hypothetical protein
MDANVRKVRAHMARLNFLSDELEKRASLTISVSYLADFFDIIQKIEDLIGEECSFLSDNIETYGLSEVYTSSLRLRVKQAISFFTEAYAKELGLEQVNITLDGLRDRMLKDRRGDLLRANDHYDRASREVLQILFAESWPPIETLRTIRSTL